MNTGQQDYKQLLSEVIKKQLAILGPAITLALARSVQGLIVADDGTVTDIAGAPQEVAQKLINEFVELSGEIVRKTMEPLITISQSVSTPTMAPVAASVPAQPIAMSAVPAAPTPTASVNPLPTLSTQEPLAQGQNPVQ